MFATMAPKKLARTLNAPSDTLDRCSASFPAAFAASGVVSAGEVERTFIAIKPDGVQRGLVCARTMQKKVQAALGALHRMCRACGFERCPTRSCHMFFAQISEVIERFERKGYKLVGIKLIKPTKAFAEKHYDDLKGRPFFNGLTDFLSSGPVVAMVSRAWCSSPGVWPLSLPDNLLLGMPSCLPNCRVA